MKQAQVSHPPVFLQNNYVLFSSFHGIRFCRFFRVFSMFVGRLTICLGICKFYKLFWPVKGKKPRNISAKTIFEGTIGLR